MGGDVEAAGFGVSFLPEAGDRAAARRIRSLAQSRSAAIVHSHFARYDLHCGLAGRATGAKVAWHVHNGIEVYTAKQRAKDLVKIRALGPLYDSVIAVSEQIRRDCVMRGVPERKLDLVLNGLVLERLAGAGAGAERDGSAPARDPRRRARLPRVRLGPSPQGRRPDARRHGALAAARARPGRC